MQIALPVWTDETTLQVLRGHAGRVSLADILARQALRAAAGGGFDVALAALDELLLRHDRSTRDRGETAPRTGWFDDVWIGSLDPLEASCGCRDFVRASLGACVHVIAALRYGVPSARRDGPAWWDPIRPLDGAAPWHARVRGAGTSPAIAALRARDERLQPRAIGAVDEHLATLQVPLFAYQRAGVHAFFRTGRLVLADDMGLGKTAQAIAIAHVLVAAGAIARALVVVPASLKWQWAREWSRFSPTSVHIVEGDAAQRARSYARTGTAIVGYEHARRDIDSLGRFELVILDEAQRIKNAGTLTARTLKTLEPRWRLALTGTPLENRLDELASIVGWVDDLALEPVWRLRAWHAMRAETGERIGARGLETVRARIAPYFLRRVRADVIAELPPRREIQIPLMSTVRQRETHDALQNGIARLAAAPRRDRVERMQLLRLLVEQRLVCNGMALAKFTDYWRAIEASADPPEELVKTLHSPKLVALRELLAAIVVDQGRRVVVFSQWERMLRLAERMTRDVLAVAGVRSLPFTGIQTAARRIENLERFHDTPEVRVLWATDVGALGLNLQAAASCCINLELPWNPAVIEQRVARLHRPGQTVPVDVYNLVTVDGIEGRIAHVLDTKQSLARSLFDTNADEIWFGANGGHGPGALWLAMALSSSRELAAGRDAA